ncbi:hypothetical protein D5085_02185 [Ectothiorhodospiraceae bacterium BW-2]|nr:hypothetical protein D5085_02185 [Ectothiorhodospiraceae bacterium BW-2]
MGLFNKKKSQPEIYLHIGTNKTGTTAIQQFLHNNRKPLLKHKILYPKAGCDHIAHYHFSYAMGFIHESKKQHPQTIDIKGLYDEFQAEKERFQPEKIIISSEMFVLPGEIERVKQFFEPYEVFIVIYLRRHDHWWLSLYNQAVKSRQNPPWQRGINAFLCFHHRRRLVYSNYRSLIDKWANVFGKEHILVRPYEKKQNLPNIFSDFLQTIGAESQTIDTTKITQPINRSLSPYVIQIMDVVQRTTMSDKSYHKIMHYLYHLDIPSESNATLLSREMAMALIEANQEDYGYIAREYLGREDDILFYDPLPNELDEFDVATLPRPMDIAAEIVRALES